MFRLIREFAELITQLTLLVMDVREFLGQLRIKNDTAIKTLDESSKILKDFMKAQGESFEDPAFDLDPLDFK